MALYTINTSPSFFKYFGVHTHEYYELILNLEGTGTMTIGSEKFPFFPGSVHIVPKNTPHIKESNDKFKDIYFLTDKLGIGALGMEENAPIAFCDDSEKTLETVMKMMLYRYLKGNKNDTVLQAMYDLAMKIVEDASMKEKAESLSDVITQRLAVSFNDPELSVCSALDGLGYTRDHMRRIFKDERGVTPGEYLTSLRVCHAKKLLKKQKELCLQIGEIAALCGYYDIRYFSRIFKRETGFTPLEYAKKHRS